MWTVAKVIAEFLNIGDILKGTIGEVNLQHAVVMKFPRRKIKKTKFDYKAYVSPADLEGVLGAIKQEVSRLYNSNWQY